MSVTNSANEIRRIAAHDTHTLRDAILRPGLPPGGGIYPGDDSPDTLHLGAFIRDMLVAVATLCREPPPEDTNATAWRLRGMATLPEFRGRGIGNALAQHCIAYAKEHRGTLVWCTSRVATAGFYRKLGFVESGDTFSLPPYSDALYIRMRRVLP